MCSVHLNLLEHEDGFFFLRNSAFVQTMMVTVPGLVLSRFSVVQNFTSSSKDISLLTSMRIIVYNKNALPYITLLRSITMFFETDFILWKILHNIQYECGEYFAKYHQSHITLLWIRIMLICII